MLRRSNWMNAAVLIAAACGGKKEPPGAAQGKPVEAAAEAPVAKAVAAVDPMSVFQASGDKLVEGENPGTNPVRWHGVVLAAVERGQDVVVRAYTAGGASDVGKPMARGDLLDSFEVAADGASVVFESHTLAARAPEVGALLSYAYARIAWDAAGDKPIVAADWSCDESSGENCDHEFAAAPPGKQEAAAIVKRWLTALAGAKADAATAFMTDDFQMLEPDAWEKERCPAVVLCVQTMIDRAAMDLARATSSKDVLAAWPKGLNNSPDQDPFASSRPQGSLDYVHLSAGEGQLGLVAVVAQTPAGPRVAGVWFYDEPEKMMGERAMERDQSPEQD